MISEKHNHDANIRMGEGIIKLLENISKQTTSTQARTINNMVKENTKPIGKA